MDISLNTPTTFHDQRPTHAPRPGYVVEAEDAERDAYGRRQAAWEAYEADPTDASMVAYIQANIEWQDANREMYAARNTMHAAPEPDDETDLADLATRGASLLAPMTFEDGEIDKVIRDHVCGLDLRHLYKRPAPERRWFACCPRCGPILPHHKVAKADAVQMEAGCRVARMELGNMGRARRSENEIMHDLGF